MGNPLKLVAHAETEGWRVGEDTDALIEWARGWVVRDPMRPASVMLLRQGKEPRRLEPGEILVRGVDGDLERSPCLEAASCVAYWKERS